MAKERILIIGAGAHAGVLLDILRQDSTKEVIGFTDPEVKGEFHDLPILGDDSVIEDNEIRKRFDSVIIGLGGDLIKVRSKIIEKARKLGIRFAKALHPSAIIADSSEIREGTAVMAGAIINPYSRIGKNCVINTGAILDHDNVIEDNVFIQPGARLAGNVHVSHDSIVGIGAVVLEKRSIGSSSIVGAGSVVTKDVPDKTVVIGVPAKKKE